MANTIKNFWDKIRNFKWTPENKRKMAVVWDKITTGILIVLMVSPILILTYLFVWFLSK